jgi:hypothetical protein
MALHKRTVGMAAGFAAAAIIGGIGTAAAFTHTPESPFGGVHGTGTVHGGSVSGPVKVTVHR